MDETDESLGSIDASIDNGKPSDFTRNCRECEPPIKWFRIGSNDFSFEPNMISSDEKKGFLSKKELAEYLGISVFTIDAWVSQRREIPFVRMGGRVLFDLEDVREWIETRKVYPRSY